MSVYAYGLGVHVRSIPFSVDDTCGNLATTEKQLLFPRNYKLPLANAFDVRVRRTLGLRFDT